MSAENEKPVKGSATARFAGCFAWLMLLGLLGGGGYWGYEEWQKRQSDPVVEGVAIAELKEDFEEAMDKRRLSEAEELIRQMQAAGATAKMQREARARVEEGRAEEKGQEVAFLVLNARAALEAGELAEAERFCSQIERVRSDHPAIAEIRGAVKENRRAVKMSTMVGEVEEALNQEEWAKGLEKLEVFDQAFPGEAEGGRLRRALVKGKEDARQRRIRAAELVARARALDDGQFSEEAIRLLEEAVRLEPSEGNRALYEKMSSYGRVLKVPGDHATIMGALKVAKANDRIMLAKGIYHESLEMPAGVTLVGESMTETVIECPAKAGAVVTVSKGVKAVRLASLTLRHSGLVNDDERFSIVAVDGGEMEGNDLVLVRASGHGAAVLNGGKLRLKRCQITDSGWDGVAATGEGSEVELSEVRCEKNLHHGVDFWDGASGTVSDSVLSGNGLNGFLAIGSKKVIELRRTKSEKNREIGVVVSGGVGFAMKECEVGENLLGGVFLGQEGQGIQLVGNKVAGNGEAGVVIEKGVEILAEENNEVKGNKGRQVWRDAEFPDGPDEETGAPPAAPPLQKGMGN